MRFKMIASAVALAVLTLNVAKAFADSPEEKKQRSARQRNKRFRICTNFSLPLRMPFKKPLDMPSLRTLGRICW